MRAKTEYVGCGMSTCDCVMFGGRTWTNATIFLCNYSPGGNSGKYANFSLLRTLRFYENYPDAVLSVQVEKPMKKAHLAVNALKDIGVTTGSALTQQDEQLINFQ